MHTHTLIFTGNSYPSISLAAAATAALAARDGYRTLLISTGPQHSINTLLQHSPTSTPITAVPGLDVWALNTPALLAEYLERIRPQLQVFPALAQISGDELPLLPGVEIFLVVEYLSRLPINQYQMIVLDAGGQDGLLRMLAFPDSVRWGIRIGLGLDREPGRSMASVGRALMPTSLLPREWLDPVQELRVQFERVRDQVAARAQVRYVLRPDLFALEEAKLVVPALHLHGTAVDGIILAPLLPPDLADARLAGSIEQQRIVQAEAARLWGLPVLGMPIWAAAGNFAELAQTGYQMYQGHILAQLADITAPISYSLDGQPAIVITLPGLQRDALSLTMSGDELIVRVGPYRRHILLPDGLRGVANIRASREGGRLVVRQRT